VPVLHGIYTKPTETALVRAAIALSMATRSLSKSSAATIPAPAAQDTDFKRCCMRSGRYDGVPRDYYFQGLKPLERQRGVPVRALLNILHPARTPRGPAVLC
jgi:hypothetical protein